MLVAGVTARLNCSLVSVFVRSRLDRAVVTGAIVTFVERAVFILTG
jgi:hypothetical protein